MKTIAEQLNVKEFPFSINDSQGNEIYCENSNGCWWRREYDDNGREIYWEDSDGIVFDNRPKSCEDKTVIEIDGAKYLLTKI